VLFNKLKKKCNLKEKAIKKERKREGVPEGLVKTRHFFEITLCG